MLLEYSSFNLIEFYSLFSKIESDKELEDVFVRDPVNFKF